MIHSFWVPEWRIKKDNVPGITTDAIVTPDEVGTYQLICTELCGAGHATMRATVVVPSNLLLTADQALEIEKQIQEKENGIEGTGVDET